MAKKKKKLLKDKDLLKPRCLGMSDAFYKRLQATAVLRGVSVSQLVLETLKEKLKIAA